MHYFKARSKDVANGPGLRTSIWLTGCNRHCKGCFNEEAWNFHAGQLLTTDRMKKFAAIGQDKEITGFSILGGEPLQQNKSELIEFLEYLRQPFLAKKTIWMWTGYTYEELDEIQLTIVHKYIDVLVDGPFIEEKKNPNLRFKGSSNQRILDIKETKKAGHPVVHKLFQ